MSLTKCVLAAFLLLASSAGLARPIEEWVARYNGPGSGSDETFALAVDAEGNIYVTGRSQGSDTYDDYATLKYDSNGDTVWVARYSGPGNGSDVAHAVAVDASGNVYITGESLGSGTYLDYATIKYRSNGDTVWVQRYNGPGNWHDRAKALAVDGSGNVYVTGNSQGDYLTMKYDPNGDTVWVRRYDGTGGSEDKPSALAVDGSGNVYVTGYSLGTSFDYATTKYDSNGNQLWAARYDGPANDWDDACAVAVDASGNVYVTGSSRGSGTRKDYATIKYDSNGDTVWVVRYNGPGNRDDEAYALTIDGEGNVHVTGTSMGYPGYYDYATIKYNSYGRRLWVARYNGHHWDEAYALALDPFGNVYVTGMSWGGADIDMDYATVKYDPHGNELWVVRYNGPANKSDRAKAVAVDASGNVYVTGYSEGFRSGWDYATIKYSQNTGIDTQNPDNSLPKDFRLTCRPNPFNATTEISYTLTEAGEVELTIYNIGGQLIETLVDGHQEAGEYQIIWDASEQASGIYFYRLSTGDFTETKRMTLLR